MKRLAVAGLLVAAAMASVLACTRLTHAADAKSANQPAPAAVETKPAGDLEPIKINVPDEVTIGTPENKPVPNLEKLPEARTAPFLAPKGVTNLALNKPVTSSDSEPTVGDLKFVTDGKKEGTEGHIVELGPGKQWVQIDLEQPATIYAVALWHFHAQKGRGYIDVIVQVADDADFITNVQTVFNNDHDNSSGLGIGQDKGFLETNKGKLIDAKGLKGRYVRLYSKGSNSSNANHYIEVEVFGKPAK